MKYHDLIASLKKGTILPLYLFFGEEDFLIQEAVDLIVKRVVDPGSRDFNFNVLHCRDVTVSEIVALAQTLPFMAEQRLVLVKGIDDLRSAGIEEITSYLKDPSPSTCFVMVSNQGKYDKKPVIAAVEARGAVTRFFPLLDREIIAWIEGWAKARGFSLPRNAAQYIWQVIGNDIQKIKNELEKVEIYLKDSKKITLDDVKIVVGNFREYSSFDLAAALGQKNREKAFLILSRLVQEGEQPVVLLGGIAWNFRRLMRAKAMEAAGSGYEDIKRNLQVIFHQSASFKEQMQSFSMEELRTVFEILLSTDKTLKSSAINGRMVLERMILQLCEDKKSREPA